MSSPTATEASPPADEAPVVVPSVDAAPETQSEQRRQGYHDDDYKMRVADYPGAEGSSHLLSF